MKTEQLVARTVLLLWVAGVFAIPFVLGGWLVGALTLGGFSAICLLCWAICTVVYE